jgi:hypothetical protein
LIDGRYNLHYFFNDDGTYLRDRSRSEYLLNNLNRKQEDRKQGVYPRFLIFEADAERYGKDFADDHPEHAARNLAEQQELQAFEEKQRIARMSAPKAMTAPVNGAKVEAKGMSDEAAVARMAALGIDAKNKDFTFIKSRLTGNQPKAKWMWVMELYDQFFPPT